jgi:hypothetical protein
MSLADGGLAADDVVPDEEEVSCVVDPREVLYGINLPVPHAGYHWNGYRTNASIFTGGKIEVEVTNPDVDHTNPPEFVANKVLSQTAPGDWLEAGWAEVSWRTGHSVYTYKTATGMWSFYAYGLNTGSFYSFRTRHCTIQGAGTQMRRNLLEWQLAAS